MTNNIRVGIARRKITPDLKKLSDSGKSFRGIHDDLYARALALDDGAMTVAIVSLDIQITAFAKLMRDLIRELTGIPQENTLLCPSHTHCVPSYREVDYWQWVARQTAEAVAEANETRQPALWGLARGEAFFNVNRTAILDGKSAFSNDMPERLDEFKEIMDRDLAVFAFHTCSNELIGMLYHYTAHPTVLYDSGWISADYPGEVAGIMEKKFGVPMLFVNGAIGDVETKPRRGEADLKVVGKGLADAVCELLSQIDRRETLSLALAWDWIHWSEKFNWRLGALRLTPDVAFAHVPSELFNELGIQIKRQSPFSKTFVACGRSTGDQDGGSYIPSRRGLEIGSYGAENWKPPEWCDLFVKKSLELLSRI